MSGSSTDPAVIRKSLHDITTPGVIVEVDAEMAEHLGAFHEDALTQAEAWRSNTDQGAEKDHA